jgi:transposase
MWTPATRRQHRRAGLRYATDLTDAEWAVIAPLMPEPALCGRPATWTPREILRDPARSCEILRDPARSCEILNAIFYVLRGGIAWRLIPKDLPPKSTAFGYFSRWRDEGLFGKGCSVGSTTIWSWLTASEGVGKPHPQPSCSTASA